jgi:hypothetical protein
MSTPNDGGPAFPYEQRSEPGMTLRDYFAAKAMQGISANSTYDMRAEATAQWAYMQADAMIAEREKGTK